MQSHLVELIFDSIVIIAAVRPGCRASQDSPNRSRPSEDVPGRVLAGIWHQGTLEAPSYWPALFAVDRTRSSFRARSPLENGLWIKSISGETPWNANTSSA